MQFFVDPSLDIYGLEAYIIIGRNMSVLSIAVAQYHMDLIQIRQHQIKLATWMDDRILEINTQPCISVADQ